jgi:hypothetical protein
LQGGSHIRPLEREIFAFMPEFSGLKLMCI